MITLSLVLRRSNKNCSILLTSGNENAKNEFVKCLFLLEIQCSLSTVLFRVSLCLLLYVFFTKVYTYL